MKRKTNKKINSRSICKEGPHSALCDEEFYDAVETGLDKIDEDNQIRDRLKKKSSKALANPLTVATKHRLWSEVRFFFLNLLTTTH